MWKSARVKSSQDINYHLFIVGEFAGGCRIVSTKRSAKIVNKVDQMFEMIGQRTCVSANEPHFFHRKRTPSRAS